MQWFLVAVCMCVVHCMVHCDKINYLRDKYVFKFGHRMEAAAGGMSGGKRNHEDLSDTGVAQVIK